MDSVTTFFGSLGAKINDSISSLTAKKEPTMEEAYAAPTTGGRKQKKKSKRKVKKGKQSKKYKSRRMKK